MNSHYWDLRSGNVRGRQIERYRSQWVDLTGDHPSNVLRIYVAWIHEAERRASRFWRLEDLDAELLASICQDIGHPVSIEQAEGAIESVSVATNRHTDPTNQPIDWDDLPEGSLKEQAMSIARRYGYL